jgi:hypothetical protein
MDVLLPRKLHQEAYGTQQALQVRCHMCDHAEKRGWAPHRCFLLVGLVNGRQQNRTMGKQVHVLHHYRLWPSRVTITNYHTAYITDYNQTKNVKIVIELEALTPLSASGCPG